MRLRSLQGELWRIDYLGRNYHPAENRIIEAIAMASDIMTLKLWKVLDQKGDDAQRKLVKSLANDAGAILDRVIETFPTYTLHNSTHAWNVAELMAELLGPRLQDLSALEAAMLILSAYWHDTGMVFNESERTALESEPYWRTFLTENPEAEVALEGAGELSMEIAEWYCRWRHADRVYVRLNNLPPGRLQWGRINIREALGELCRSHNLDVAEIKISDALQNNYLETADLKFCESSSAWRTSSTSTTPALRMQSIKCSAWHDGRINGRSGATSSGSSTWPRTGSTFPSSGTLPTVWASSPGRATPRSSTTFASFWTSSRGSSPSVKACSRSLRTAGVVSSCPARLTAQHQEQRLQLRRVPISSRSGSGPQPPHGGEPLRGPPRFRARTAPERHRRLALSRVLRARPR